jgi:hypothetical protein
MVEHQHASPWPQQRCSDRREVWLVTLIDELEQTGSDLRAIPCDPAIVAAFRVHLARPPLPRVNCSFQGRLLN